ncbi:hypothetical protein N0V90_004294 [Kalmusia sp. IMI 367209]|nr:hypothetical protein N0V90_004294 [Kalmusia sp. IMI 367209]
MIILYHTLLFSFYGSTTAASIKDPAKSHFHLYKRQAIPDQNGNTGNNPAPVKLTPPPRPLTSSASTTVVITSTSSIVPRPTSNPPTSSNGNSNTNDNNGSNLPPADELKLTRTNVIMSPGTLAGIITGSAVLFILILVLIIFLIRRRRRPEITEIPIRRSKLGSLLRHRVFNSPLPPSRTGSRSSQRTLTGDSREGWLHKDSIGRPVPTKWGEGLLSVPQAAFMKNERESVEEGEKWIDKEMISAPRPGRPASAEPLGRLSGMGLGMGYLK